MSKNRNGLLGVGGQRRNISRRALRGESSGERAGGDPKALKRELARRMQERLARRTDAAE
ncbi:DUF6243 family protein [Actinomadura macrotermitis]|uniref:Uncharacterized protein n=1 Tax=Actinomadura macrotermitis TaxID=2585200 RepID=A0A7K0BUK4_9ACTN|nr:DUF6243 family protein [Actinomadura macrotermitis]MQY04817.1 hypothetical protein [Actinomadura macrotermitis]